MPDCWKRRFATRVSAGRAISLLHQTRRGRKKHNAVYTGAKLEPYTCPTCGGIHVGHRHTRKKP